MGKYRSYADRLDALARKNFQAYQEAAERLEEARKEKSRNPVKSGWGVTPEMVIKSQRAALAYNEANDAFKRAKTAFNASLKEIQGLREELEIQLNNDLLADPAKLDASTIALLQSGICSPKEIKALYNKAEEAGNTTLQRYIGRFAEGESKRISDMTIDESKKAEYRSMMNDVAARGRNANSLKDNPALMGFDAMAYAYQRCENNPAMIKYWDELTQNPKEAM